MKRGAFHWDIVLKTGCGIALAICLVNLIGYWTKWDFFSLAGLFKQLVSTLFFPLAGFIAGLYALMRRQGSATFLELLVHCILIAAVVAAVVGGYWCVFLGYIEPDYYRTIAQASYEGLLESSRQVEAIDAKTEILKQAERFRKLVEENPKFDPLRLLQNELVRYMLVGLVFGSVLAFVLSKIRVMSPEASAE